MQQDYDSCRKSEDSAREALVQQWSTFLPADRGSCFRLTTTGTPGTYTELLTCLEMKRDARKLPDTTIGLGSAAANARPPSQAKTGPALRRARLFLGMVTKWYAAAAARGASGRPRSRSA